ncbi:MAG: hypothetical protein JWO06_1498 [Bacteroidota bacterium]|nr:hypothetical protein [Bacteroidota bacterium]
MKKLFTLLLFIVTLPSGILAQGNIHLFVGYLPSHTYLIDADQLSKIEILYSGDAEAMKKVAENPAKKTVMVYTQKEMSTGKLYRDSLFSIKTVFKKEHTLGGSTTIPIGSTIYATGSKSGRMTVDSMLADGMDSELKEMLMPMMKAALQQVVVPEHTIRVGESFTFATPLRIPVASMVLDFSIKSTYKLKSVSGSVAYFDISQTYVMESESVTMPITADGTGKGTMTYDISSSYFTQYELTSSINMNLKAPEMNMKMKIESTETQKVVISAN